MQPHNMAIFHVDRNAGVGELTELASCIAGTVTEIVSNANEMRGGAQQQRMLFGALYLGECVEKILEAIQERIAEGALSPPSGGTA